MRQEEEYAKITAVASVVVGLVFFFFTQVVSPGWWRQAAALRTRSSQLWRLFGREAECQPPQRRWCDPHRSPKERRTGKHNLLVIVIRPLIGWNQNTPYGRQGLSRRVQSVQWRYCQGRHQQTRSRRHQAFPLLLRYLWSYSTHLD